jgi:hypothetical protein
MRRFPALRVLVGVVTLSLAPAIECGGATTDIPTSGNDPTKPPVKQQDPPSDPTPSPEPTRKPAPPPPVGQQGVSGRVEKWTGDFMPGPGPGKGKVEALSVPVHVFKGRVPSTTKPDPSHPQLVAIVKSDANGFYMKDLEAGEYTVVAEINGALYLNSYSGANEWSSINVASSKWTNHEIVDSSEASF